MQHDYQATKREHLLTLAGSALALLLLVVLANATPDAVQALLG